MSVRVETGGWLKGRLFVLRPAFDYGVVLVDGDLPGLPEIGNLYVVQLDVEALGDGGATSEAGNVLQHTLTLIPEARSPHGSHLQRATQLVHHESSQRLALNLLCDDEQRLADLCDLPKQREQVHLKTDFLFVNENVDVLEGNLHAFGVSDEVG